MSEAMYKLEYWVDKRNYSKEELESKLSHNLEKLDIEITVKAESNYYLVIIEADKHNIDACHDHLNYDREEVFRAKDELGDELRSNAYPILSEIETRLRRFITRAMIEVLDFNWWYRSTPEEIRKNVSRIERRSGSKPAEDHHQIEFTMFDDLIELVTGKYQKWSDAKNLTPVDLAQLLDDCENIEDLQQKLSQNREQTSLWEDVFSNYFDDKKAWRNLESKIDGIVIPIRNKVMHHRLIRMHDVRQLKESRDELLQIIGTAKSELPQADLNKALKSLHDLVENARFQFVLDPEIIERLKKSARIDPEIIKTLTRPPLIDSKLFIPRINFGLQGFDDDSTSAEQENGSNEDKENEDDEENNQDNDADDEEESEN